MGGTLDQQPGELIEESILLEDIGEGLADVEGRVRYSGGRFSLYDSGGEYDPRAGGGLSAAQHKALRQLIHFIDEGPADGFASGAYKEVLGGLFPTSVIWWESAGKTQKIVEKTITRSGGGATNIKPTPIEWKMYDTDGTTVLVTVSDAITYTGASEASRTRTIT